MTFFYGYRFWNKLQLSSEEENSSFYDLSPFHETKFLHVRAHKKFRDEVLTRLTNSRHASHVTQMRANY